MAMVRRDSERPALRCGRTAGAGPLLLTLTLLTACDPFDRQLLGNDGCGDGRVEADERCDIAIAPGAPGACPAECAPQNGCAIQVPVGHACSRECVNAAIRSPRDGDSCCPPGATSVQDSDCDVCGDGMVGASERCDPPEACPTAADCVSGVQCIALELGGSAESCTAHCEFRLIEQCVGGDACCPSGCDVEADSDCSLTCGDGKVESDRGETCETDNPAARCLTSCDDADPCTTDMLLGSSENCNVSCARMVIEQAADGDGCCPIGVRAMRDRDCTELFQPALAHRYRFADPGATVGDWLGNANATLANVEARGDGSLDLAGGSSHQHVILPSGLISAEPSVTLEAWVTLRGSSPGQFERIFDFGNNENGLGEQGIASSFFYLTPSTDDGVPRLSFAPVASQRARVDGSAPLPREQPIHFAAVLDGVERRMTLYIDGASVGSAAVDMPLAALDDVNNWLGRSQYAQDEDLRATLHEFRVYGSALSASQVAASFAAGPDPAAR